MTPKTVTVENRSALTAKILRQAQKLVAKKNGWTSGSDAVNHLGTLVAWDDPAAVAFCAGGACAKAAASVAPSLQGEALRVLRKGIGVRGRHGVSKWNDRPRRTQKQVVAAFDKAIKLAAS